MPLIIKDSFYNITSLITAALLTNLLISAIIKIISHCLAIVTILQVEWNAMHIMDYILLGWRQTVIGIYYSCR